MLGGGGKDGGLEWCLVSTEMEWGFNDFRF